MTQFNTANERLKNEFQRYLREAQGLTASTIAQHMSALLEFEQSNGLADFSTFSEDQAVAFKDRLRSPAYTKAGRPLSANSIRSRLLSVKKFFGWLLTQRLKAVKFNRATIDFLNPNRAEVALAKTSVRTKTVPTLEQLYHLMEILPKETDAQRRVRATLAVLALTACRVTALSTVKLKHLDLDRRVLTLDAREVRTKASKSFLTPFFPLGQIFEDELRDWVDFLRREKLFGPNDPLIPRLESKALAGEGFVAGGLSRDPVKAQGFISQMVGDAFEGAGLPRTSPHRFRDMVVEWLANANLTVEEHRAFSLSLGHADLSITLSSYGVPSPDQQVRIMDSVRERVQPRN